MELAEKAVSGEFDVKFLAGLYRLTGVGVWTAEMLMTFSMRRPNIMSYGDLAIHRGLRMLYHCLLYTSNFVDPELGDPASLDIYYCMEGDLPLTLPGIDVTIPMDQPYQGFTIN